MLALGRETDKPYFGNDLSVRSVLRARNVSSPHRTAPRGGRTATRVWPSPQISTHHSPDDSIWLDSRVTFREFARNRPKPLRNQSPVIRQTNTRLQIGRAGPGGLRRPRAGSSGRRQPRGRSTIPASTAMSNSTVGSDRPEPLTSTSRSPSMPYVIGSRRAIGSRIPGSESTGQTMPAQQRLRDDHQRDELEDLELGPGEGRQEDAQVHRARARAAA